jgi:DNA replication protein DnaC
MKFNLNEIRTVTQKRNANYIGYAYTQHLTFSLVSDWAAILGDTAATAAILDRFLENSVVFTIKGKSFRLSKNTQKEET